MRGIALAAAIVAVLMPRAAAAQALPYPNPKSENCAPGYRSSGGYCAVAVSVAQNAERNMTCIGPYRGVRVGNCDFTDNSKGIDSVERACRLYRLCVIRARVILEGEPVGDWIQPYTVLKVYSARRPRADEARRYWKEFWRHWKDEPTKKREGAGAVYPQT
jgi:hypothetical protein